MTYHETGSKDIVELNLNTNPTKSVSCCAWFLPPETIFVSSGPQSCKIIIIMMMIIIHLAVKHKFTVQTMRSRRRLHLCKCVSAACALRQKDNFVEPWGGTSSRQFTKKKQKTPRKTEKQKHRWAVETGSVIRKPVINLTIGTFLISSAQGSRCTPMTRFSRLSRPRFNHAPWLCSTELLSQG